MISIDAIDLTTTTYWLSSSVNQPTESVACLLHSLPVTQLTLI